ncbi:MAG: GNAT family N-acetyltransferase [Chromatiales bacterium]|nr:GNAT family N-acetyltransferase [Chromatiales bacterium]
MKIQLATTDTEIATCYPVMQQLRPHITEEEFLPRVREQQESGYLLAYIEDEGEVVAVAGFRLGLNLAWGRFLYVDDLVILAQRRSTGYGKQLLQWLHDYALEHACEQLHLDSGLQRKEAHRFYLREGMSKASYHFVDTLGSP